MRKKKTAAAARKLREQDLIRAFVIEAVARVLSLARTQANVMEDDDLLAVLERADALLFHEATHFLKIPYRPRQKRRG